MLENATALQRVLGWSGVYKTVIRVCWSVIRVQNCDIRMIDGDQEGWRE